MEPIRINVRVGRSGLLMAHSPDLPGLHAMERTAEQLKATLLELIPILYRERGQNVAVSSIEELPSDIEPAPWIIAGLKAVAAAKVD